MYLFEFKLAFENADRIRVWLLKESCRTLNLEQLLFLEIFELPYKFESNLKNKTSGNSVNSWNSASRQLSPPASFHWLLRAPSGDTSSFNVSTPSRRVKRTFDRRSSLADKTGSALPSLILLPLFFQSSPSRSVELMPEP